MLASVGLDEAAEKKNDTYNNRAIEYAKLQLRSWKAAQNPNPVNSVLISYEYNTKDNAIGWMNYTIGYIEYYRQNKKDEGLNNLYKATQIDSETKDRAFIYALIGDKYVEKADALNKEIVTIIEH